MPPHILYRTSEGSVTTRKPKDAGSFEAFITDEKVSQSLRSFAKQIITDAHELNLLKNDLCFLIDDIYGDIDKDLHASTVRLTDVVTFYVWVCLPYAGKSVTMKEVQTSVFPFDLYHHPHPMSLSQIQEIRTILEQDIGAYVHTRKHGVIPQLPHQIRGRSG